MFDFNQDFLVKFVEPEFTESTLDGQLFFKRNGYFINLEKEYLNKGIGDKREGSWTIPLNPETHRMVVIDKEGNDERVFYLARLLYGRHA